MDTKTFKEKIVSWCKECKGTGLIKGTQSLIPGNVSFVMDQETRITDHEYTIII